MDIGDEWIYRRNDDASSERVRILAVQVKKTTSRVDVEFLDAIDGGRQENVPANRLKGPWSAVGEYDALMANWDRIGAYRLTETEESAVGQAFSLLIPDAVADWQWKPVRYSTAVHDQERLEAIIGVPASAVAESVEAFDHEGTLMLSTEGTLLIAEYACRVNPMPVLEWVISEEEDYRARCERGQRRVSSISGKDYVRDPDQEYEWYRSYGRPLLELLRQWCGQRAATLQERLGAAEAEVQRLNVLVAQLIDGLRQNNASNFADVIERTNAEERITPENFRPVVDRPLKPSEMPVRYVKQPRRWGY